MTEIGIEGFVDEQNAYCVCAGNIYFFSNEREICITFDYKFKYPVIFGDGLMNHKCQCVDFVTMQTAKSVF